MLGQCKATGPGVIEERQYRATKFPKFVGKCPGQGILQEGSGAPRGLQE